MQPERRKSVFITGAAPGMRRATALLFARQGWFVGAYDLNEAQLETPRIEIGAENGRFGTLEAADPVAFEAAIQGFGTATGGTLDLMFSNAGIAVPGLFDEARWADIIKVVGVNFLGVLCLVNASSSAIFGTARIAVYSATRHAVRGLTEAVAIEFKRFGARAADLLPGLVDTPILSDGLRAIAPHEGMWRLVSVAEVAQIV